MLSAQISYDFRTQRNSISEGTRLPVITCPVSFLLFRAHLPSIRHWRFVQTWDSVSSSDASLRLARDRHSALPSRMLYPSRVCVNLPSVIY